MTEVKCCSVGYCREPIASPGARKCLAHLQKADEQRRRYLALPLCAWSGCKQHTKNGLCPEHQREQDELDEAGQALANRVSRFRLLRSRISSAQSFDKLRDLMVEIVDLLETPE